MDPEEEGPGEQGASESLKLIKFQISKGIETANCIWTKRSKTGDNKREKKQSQLENRRLHDCDSWFAPDKEGQDFQSYPCVGWFPESKYLENRPMKPSWHRLCPAKEVVNSLGHRWGSCELIQLQSPHASGKRDKQIADASHCHCQQWRPSQWNSFF